MEQSLPETEGEAKSRSRSWQKPAMKGDVVMHNEKRLRLCPSSSHKRAATKVTGQLPLRAAFMGHEQLVKTLCCAAARTELMFAADCAAASVSDGLSTAYNEAVSTDLASSPEYAAPLVA